MKILLQKYLLVNVIIPYHSQQGNPVNPEHDYHFANILVHLGIPFNTIHDNHTPNNHLGNPVYPKHDYDIAKIHLGNPVYPKHDNHTAKNLKHYPTLYSNQRSPVNPKHDYHFAQIHLGNPVFFKCTDIHSIEVT